MKLSSLRQSGDHCNILGCEAQLWEGEMHLTLNEQLTLVVSVIALVASVFTLYRQFLYSKEDVQVVKLGLDWELQQALVLRIALLNGGTSQILLANIEVTASITNADGIRLWTPDDFTPAVLLPGSISIVDVAASRITKATILHELLPDVSVANKKKRTLEIGVRYRLLTSKGREVQVDMPLQTSWLEGPWVSGGVEDPARHPTMLRLI